jgi:hypothetical protein
VSGAAAAAGSVRLGSGKRVAGTLGGTRFDIGLAGVHLARAGALDRWPARAERFPLAGLVEHPR